MRGNAKINIKGLREFQSKIDKLKNKNVMEPIAKGLAQTLLTNVVAVTPVGQYPERVGGTLRRGWMIEEAKRSGDTISVSVTNPVMYAEYVEYGHRQQPGRYVPALGKCLKKEWVEGQFFMRDTVQAVQANADTIVQAKLDQLIREELE